MFDEDYLSILFLGFNDFPHELGHQLTPPRNSSDTWRLSSTVNILLFYHGKNEAFSWISSATAELVWQNWTGA
jgi:hypothetical protein